MLFTYSRDDAYSQVKKSGRNRKCGRPRKARSSGPLDTPAPCITSPAALSDEGVPKHGQRTPVNSKSSPTGGISEVLAQKRVSKSDSHVSNHVAPPVVVAKKVAKVGVSPRGRGRPPTVSKVIVSQPPPTTQCIFVTYAGAGTTSGVGSPLEVAVPQVLTSMPLQQPVLPSPARARLQTRVATPPRLVASIAARPRLVTPASVVQLPRHVVASVGTPLRHVVISSVGTPLRQVAPASIVTPPRQVATATVGTPPRQVAVVVQPWSNPNLVIRTRRASGQLGTKNVIHVRQQQPLPKVSVMSQFATTGTRTVLLSVPNTSMPIVNNNNLAAARLVASSGPAPAQNRVLNSNIVYRHHVPSNTVPILEKMALQLRQSSTTSTAGATSLLQTAPVGFNLFSRISAAAAAQQQVLLQPQLIAVPTPTQTPVPHADTNGTIGKDPV